MPFDPFEMLGLPPRFQIDPVAMQRAYLLRSAAIHPDLADNPAAVQASAELNHARHMLEDPESRADALLARLGGPSREADRSLPDGFLAQMMSIREELQEALDRGDSAAASRLDDWAAVRRNQHIADVASRFDGLGNPPTAVALKAIRRELNAWRYIERMLEQIRSGQAL